MKKMLIARSRYDDATAYLYHWSTAVVAYAKDKGFDVFDLTENNVTMDNLIGHLKRIKPSFVFLNGHGDERAFYGYKNEEAINPSSADSLTGSIAFVRACRCLVELGEAAVTGGCKSFIGYSDNFWIPFSHERVSTPLRDPIAKPVMEASNTVANEIVKGLTAQEAVDASHQVSRDAIMKLLYSKEYLEDLKYHATLKALVINDELLSMKGDSKASIS